VETAVSLVAMFALVGVLSSLAGRLVSRRKGALWVWDHASIIGWGLIVAGAALILAGFFVDQGGVAMSTKLGFGSLLMLGGLWLIW
jgi:hypothetical protein